MLLSNAFRATNVCLFTFLTKQMHLNHNCLLLAKLILSFIYRTISNDVPLSPIAPPTYETIPGTYEEIAAVKATPTAGKSGYDYTVNEAYSTVTN